jgi:hypothetical protein
MYSSEYYAHRRALSHLWHLHNRAWFRNHLNDLEGEGPLQRLIELANGYQLDLTDLGDVSSEAWKLRVKHAVSLRAENDLNATLASKGLPIQVQPGFKSRDYVEHGGSNARAGLQLRWELLHMHHTNRQHAVTRPSLTGLVGKIMEGPLPATTHRLRNRTLQQIGHELSGVIDPASSLPYWLRPHVQGAIRSLSWPNMKSETLKDLLKIVDLVFRREKRRQAAEDASIAGGEITLPSQPSAD